MATPVIPELPPAPTRADGAVDFSTKADALAAAWPPTIVALNASYAWVAQQVSATEGYKNAAATSATASAGSATLSGQRAGEAAAQVVLAQAQVALAVTAKNEAQAAAQAAGAAAGLPPQRTPFTVLQVGSDGVVFWGYGLPDRTNAKIGQSLILGTNKVPGYDWAGQQVGDLLITSRNPGAAYLACNGGIRLQSAYPDLFAKVGLIGGQPLKAFQTTITTPAIFSRMKASATGTIIAVSDSTIYRSVNKGKTWAAVATGVVGPKSLDTDDAGTWILMQDTSTLRVSTNDGATWSTVTGTLPAVSGGQYTGIVYAGLGAWLAYNTWGTNLYRTTNLGSVFTAVPTGSSANGASTVVSDGQGTVLVAGSDYLRKSLNAGQSFGTSLSRPSGALAIATDKNGAWLLNATNNSYNASMRSVDNAANFAPAYGPFVDSTLSIAVADGVFYISQADGSIYSLQKNGGYVLQLSATPAKSNLTHVGGLSFIASTSQTANTTLYNSDPTFNYDTATQFALPLVTPPNGMSSYIKALEAA
ncbi:WD40/YVTN/BNR-like repeat-containing protein [Pseudomonas putida]|uniref:WD40/YVTN/BNR-like repeat-containing protein n=1 Tax=Pseudomonas putida TaxID=303 RepID=UPI0039E11F3F